MQKVKKQQQKEKQEVKNTIECFSKFKNARMVRIAGSFMGGGFNISQNKIKAILENKEMLQKFANGEHDKDIDSLKEDEILML